MSCPDHNISDPLHQEDETVEFDGFHYDECNISHVLNIPCDCEICHCSNCKTSYPLVLPCGCNTCHCWFKTVKGKGVICNQCGSSLFDTLVDYASNKEPDACYILGRMYYKGYGVERNEIKARKYYAIAISKGCSYSHAYNDQAKIFQMLHCNIMKKKRELKKERLTSKSERNKQQSITSSDSEKIEYIISMGIPHLVKGLTSLDKFPKLIEICTRINDHRTKHRLLQKGIELYHKELQTYREFEFLDQNYDMDKRRKKLTHELCEMYTEIYPIRLYVPSRNEWIDIGEFDVPYEDDSLRKDHAEYIFVNGARDPNIPLNVLFETYEIDDYINEYAELTIDREEDYFYFYMIHKACCEKDKYLLELCLDRGMNPDMQTSLGMTPLDILIHFENEYMNDVNHKRESNIVNEMIDMLIEKTINPRRKFYGSSYLHRTHSVKTAQKLINLGADVNAQNYYGETPLHKVYNLDLAKLFVENGAEVNIKDIKGRTPLHYANKIEIVSLLLNNYVDINVTDENGETALFFLFNSDLSTTDRNQIIFLMLDKGADITIKNNKGSLPFEEAIEKGKITSQDVLELVKKIKTDIALLICIKLIASMEAAKNKQEEDDEDSSDDDVEEEEDDDGSDKEEDDEDVDVEEDGDDNGSDEDVEDDDDNGSDEDIEEDDEESSDEDVEEEVDYIDLFSASL